MVVQASSDDSKLADRRRGESKVFGLGVSKTGTSTLRRCLEELGYRVKGPDFGLTKQVKAGNLNPVFRAADAHDGFEDWPWPLVYKEMDQRYPGSKFILTTRKDSETWFESLRRHAERKGPTKHRTLVFGRWMPHGHKAEQTAFYEEHNQSVRDYFSDRKEDLLEVCWETGSGWEDLCQLLDCEVPKGDIPHANKKSESKVSTRLRKLKRWAGALGRYCIGKNY